MQLRAPLNRYRGRPVLWPKECTVAKSGARLSQGLVMVDGAAQKTMPMCLVEISHLLGFCEKFNFTQTLKQTENVICNDFSIYMWKYWLEYSDNFEQLILNFPTHLSTILHVLAHLFIILTLCLLVQFTNIVFDKSRFDCKSWSLWLTTCSEKVEEGKGNLGLPENCQL